MIHLQPFMAKAKDIKERKEKLFKEYYDNGVMPEETVEDIAEALYAESIAVYL